MKKLMLGNEAVARGAYEAGVRVVSSYPGTPSTEITENMAKYEGPHVEWAPNEKVALEVSCGASFGGGRAMSCMKHVGLNVAADPLFTVSYTGVNAGLVVVVADDPGMHSSQNEQDSRFYARSAHIPMLEPADSQEAKDFTRRAFALSEEYDTPILLRMCTRISHARSLVEQGEVEQVALKPFQKDPMKYVMMPGMARARHLVVETRMEKMAQNAASLGFNRVEMGDSKIGIVTDGTAYQYVKEAMPEASVLKLGMVYPIAMDQVKAFAQKVEKLYVVEELEPFIEDQLRAAGISVSGGKDLFGRQGELTAAKIAEKLAGRKMDAAPAAELPQRPPVLCPGCPHRATFYVLNKLKLTVTGDIGCYTLGAMAPLSAVDACVCMGASIGMAHGMEKAGGEAVSEHTVAVIGDSTFIHSGITGLIDIVYNKGNATVLILDNSTTGMTGHQPNPATGKTIRLEDTYQVDLKALCQAVGVQHVREVDPFNMKELEQALREETARKAPSVIICRRPCVLLSKQQTHSLRVNNDACRNCRACMKIGCPAIEKRDKGVWINPALCNSCGLCVQMCAFSAIEKAGE